jgi:signal transduction histidine kinase
VAEQDDAQAIGGRSSAPPSHLSHSSHLAGWWPLRRGADGLYLRNIVAAVLPLMVAALAILAFHYAYSLATVKSVYRANAQREMALDLQRLERFFAERQLILTGIARTMSSSGRDLLANMGKLTDGQEQLGAFFEGLYLQDLEGNVFGVRGERFNVKDRPYFEAVMRGQNAFSDVLVSRATGNRIVIALVPIRDSFGAVIGALGGAIPVANLLSEMTVAERGESHAVLLDRGGALLAGSGLGADERKIIADAVAGLRTDARAVTEISIPIEGRNKPYLAVLGQLPQLGWDLGLLWPIETIEKDARHSLLYGVLFSLVFIGLAGGFSLWTTRQALAPLHRVADSIRALSRGDRNVRAPVTGEDDIAQIGMAFNDMAAHLANREGELKEQAALLEKQARSLEIANVQYAEEREAALAASRAKSEFLSNMSHELRTPLNAVLGFSELLSAMPPTASRETVASYAGEIHSAARALLGHIDAILAYAQLDARSYTPDAASTAIADIIRGAIQLVEQRASSKGLRIRAEIAEVLPPVVVDGAAIRRVLVQLLSNAIKFTASDGMIRVRAPLPQGHELAIHVQDSGVGIAPDQLDRVFDPFWQAEPAMTRSTAGLGLGLAYAKRLIEINGGRIAIESRPGAGTTVSCYLPLAV